MLEIQNVSKTFNAGTVNEKTALNGLNLTLNDGRLRHRHRRQRRGQVHHAERRRRRLARGLRQASSSTAWTSPVCREHKRAAYIGRVFQDPMMGTAATMQIEENLALAARRGKPRSAPHAASPRRSGSSTVNCSRVWIWAWRTV